MNSYGLCSITCLHGLLRLSQVQGPCKRPTVLAKGMQELSQLHAAAASAAAEKLRPIVSSQTVLDRTYNSWRYKPAPMLSRQHVSLAWQLRLDDT